MKRLLHFLARVYPRSWRERYETEFAALLDDAQPRWFDIFDLLKGGLAMRVMSSRISVMAVIFALAGGMVALGVSYAMPKRWMSRAAIDVFVPGGGGYQDRLKFLASYVLTDDFLERLASKYDLYPNVSTPAQRMRKSIMIRLVRQNEFEISFVHPDRSMATEVTNEIANRFIEGNMEIAARFIQGDGDNRFIRAEDLMRHAMRVGLVAPATTALVRVNPLPAASVGLAGGLILGIAVGWALRRWTAGRSAAAAGQG
jgi:hypothetical protein